MFIALASASQDAMVKPALARIAASIEKQLFQHYAPFWQADGMNVRVVGIKDAVLRDPGTASLIVYDEPDEPDVLGYHSLGGEARVYGKAFWKVIAQNGGTLSEGANSLSCTLSHEALEMVGNPYVNFWADVSDTTQEGIEMCDRVEGDSYAIDGVAVSNFLGPRAFRDGVGPWDWMRLLTSPFEIREGGYAIRRHTSTGRVFNVWGASYPDFKKTLKTSNDSRLAQRTSLLETISEKEEGIA